MRSKKQRKEGKCRVKKKDIRTKEQKHGEEEAVLTSVVRSLLMVLNIAQEFRAQRERLCSFPKEFLYTERKSLTLG